MCITYPPHPLFGKRLKVVGRRAKEKNIFWRVVLPDGSRTDMPSSWTDHSVQNSSSVSSAWITRTTPKALRDLISLMQTCAWHDSDTVLLAERLEVKSPALTGRATPITPRRGKGRSQKWVVRRKHEANPCT
ncbi:MAG: hypothetical protein H8E10_00820 [Desulfobacterales bacterium]|nr:hypothetical protein [Desulfobacterales bacterium]MBL7203359.1 hypothetical protein [Desulfobacteraceae bacterium]